MFPEHGLLIHTYLDNYTPQVRFQAFLNLPCFACTPRASDGAQGMQPAAGLFGTLLTLTNLPWNACNLFIAWVLERTGSGFYQRLGWQPLNPKTDLGSGSGSDIKVADDLEQALNEGSRAGDTLFARVPVERKPRLYVTSETTSRCGGAKRGRTALLCCALAAGGGLLVHVNRPPSPSGISHLQPATPPSIPPPPRLPRLPPPSEPPMSPAEDEIDIEMLGEGEGGGSGVARERGVGFGGVGVAHRCHLWLNDAVDWQETARTLMSLRTERGSPSLWGWT